MQRLSFSSLNCFRLSSSWQKTLTTFCPVIVSSMQPFSRPRSFCCARKKRLLWEPIFFAAKIISPTITREITVSGISRISMETSVPTTDVALLISCGIL